jgi:hypothetical protein
LLELLLALLPHPAASSGNPAHTIAAVSRRLRGKSNFLSAPCVITDRHYRVGPGAAGAGA